ncbi:hypothetical protein V6N13_014028 [Hibiscus sabdariffa]
MDLFLYDRHHLEHAGFICAKASSCCVIGGSCSNAARNIWQLQDSTPRTTSRRFSRGGPPYDFDRNFVSNNVVVSTPHRAYEAPTPGSGWASTPGSSYSEAGTPKDSGSQT